MSRAFRVFFSSTFSDFQAERDALHAEVFPAVEAFCRLRVANFQAVDLRWGISEEAGRDHRALEICLEEARRCQRAGLRPNFVLLLGDRYGWRPVPPRVPAEEFERLLAASPRPELMRRWYALDENALRPEYLLLPGPPEEWAGAEGLLRAALLDAVAAMSWPEDDTRRVRYEASVTHQEVLQGLAPEGAGGHALAYVRRMALPDSLAVGGPRAAFGDYLPDGEGGLRRDPTAREGLARLEALVRSAIPEQNLHEYEGGAALDVRAFCARVRADLERLIEAELERRAEMAQAPGGEEAEAHAAFGRERCRHFVGRRGLRERDIPAYLGGESRRPLVLLGPSGAGKTALMARAAEDAAAERLVLRRHLGTTPASSELRGLLNSLSAELAWHLKAAFAPAADLAGAELAFAGVLSKAAGRGVALFLDAVDQLSPAGGAHELNWLPRELPPGVKLVASALERDGPEGQAARSARALLPEGQVLVVPPLEQEEASRLLFDEWLAAEAGRRLTAPQREAVEARLRQCRLPLYLRAVFEEVRRWRSFDGVPLEIAADTPGLLHQLFGRLEQRRHHGPVMARRALGYLAAARSGLSDREVLGVLSADEEVMADFHEFSPTERRKAPAERLRELPPIYWSRLYFDLAGYLSEREADGTTALGFYHRQVAEAVRERYLAGEGRRPHGRLAAYFGAQPHRFEGGGGPNLRKATELGWQLEQAGDLEGLGRLLREDGGGGRNNWHSLCEEAGRTEAFADDVARAWRLAEGEADGRAYGLQCRYALVAASLAGLAKNLHPELLGLLVARGKWSARRALAHALHTPGPEQRLKALAAVAPHLPLAERPPVIAEALRAAGGFQDEAARWALTAALAAGLPEKKRAEVAAEALAAVASLPNKSAQSRALARMAPKLPEGLMGEAIRVASALDDHSRAETLVSLSAALPEGMLVQAVSAATAIGGASARWRALAALAGRLPEERRAEVQPEAFRAAAAIEEPSARADALLALARRLPEALRGEALAAAQGIADGYHRLRALAVLACYLPEAERSAAMIAAFKEASAELVGARRCEALALLALHLSAGDRARVLQRALEEASSLDKGQRYQALAALAPYLAEDMLAEALGAASSLEDELHRSGALAALAPRLPERLLGEALQAGSSIEEGQYRYRALAALAPRLPEALVERAVAAASAIDDQKPRCLALLALTTRLPEGRREEVLREALRAAFAIWDGPDRDEALEALLPRLPDALLGEALEGALGIGDELQRHKALVSLSAQLPEETRDRARGEAVRAAVAIKPWHRRQEALVALLPLLPEPARAAVLAQARKDVGEAGDAFGRCKALAALAPYLPESERAPLLGEALKEAPAVEHSYHRCEALAALAPCLPEGLVAEALHLAREARDAYSQPQALAALAARLPEGPRAEVLVEALRAAANTENGHNRPHILSLLAARLPEGLAETLARACGPENYRPEALAAHVSRLPKALRREALDVSRLVREPDEGAARAIGEALEAARRFSGEYLSEALVALAPCLPDALLGEALTAARGIEDGQHRFKALEALAGCIPEQGREEVVREAFLAATSIGEDYRRYSALQALAPHLTEGLLAGALQLAASLEGEDHRAGALAALAARLPEGLLGQALDAACSIRQEHDRSEALAALAPHLPGGLVSRALQAAQAIRQEALRARAAGPALIRLHQLQAPQGALAEGWRRVLRTLGALPRPQLLEGLEAAAPVLAALGGAEAVSEAVEGVVDAARWWP